MGSFLKSFLILLAPLAILLIASEVTAARDLAETTTEMNKGEVDTKTTKANLGTAEYGSGGYYNGGNGGYGGGYANRGGYYNGGYGGNGGYQNGGGYGRNGGYGGGYRNRGNWNGNNDYIPENYEPTPRGVGGGVPAVRYDDPPYFNGHN